MRTLSESHADFALPHDELARTLARAKEKQRFTGLRILHASASEGRGEVLFFARIFERGQDRSFAELSDFVRENGSWRYASGITLAKADLPVDLDAMTPASFVALAEAKAGRAN